jgi:hypothetical protein
MTVLIPEQYHHWLEKRVAERESGTTQILTAWQGMYKKK